MEKKLVKFGSSSWGVIIPHGVIKALNLNPEKDKILLTFNGEEVTLKPSRKKVP
jgi:antitoxin component of MazEF toxin-antitoxin module